MVRLGFAAVFALGLEACTATATPDAPDADATSSDGSAKLDATPDVSSDAPGIVDHHVADTASEVRADGSDAADIDTDADGAPAPLEGGDAPDTDNLDAAPRNDADAAENDAPDADGSAGPCFPHDVKECNWNPQTERRSGYAVSTSDPHYGCGSPGCTPCQFPHAQATCASGQCALGPCDESWADCDHDPSNGCETDLLDAASCGACAAPCASGSYCSEAGCTAACEPPLTACGTRCSDSSTSKRDCGGCGSGAGSCALAQSTPACAPGTCSSSCVTTSAPDLMTDPMNCGACGAVCPTVANGFKACAAGACAPQCECGFLLCGDTCIDPLRNIDHCGQCGAVCSSGLCLHGQCEADSWSLVSGRSSISDLAVDDNDLFFSDLGDNTVYRLPKTGAASAPAPVAANLHHPSRIALDGAYVYWTDTLGDAILRAPKTGATAPEVVATASSPTELYVDSTAVYWLASGVISRLDRAGGTITQIAPTAGAPDSTPSTMEITDTFVYWVEEPPGGANTGRLMGQDRASGVVTLGDFDGEPVFGDHLVGAHRDRFFVAGSSDHYQWLESRGINAATATLDHGANLEILVGRAVADDTYVYGAIGSASGPPAQRIDRIRYQGGPVSIGSLPSSVTSLGRLALDDAFVYWVYQDGIGRSSK